MGDIIKFIFVALCFLLCLSYGKRTAGRKDALLLRLAMLFTMLADFCLLVVYLPALGVGLFCIVQLTYILRYSGKKAPALLTSALALVVFSATLLIFRLDILYALSAAYALCFCFSLFYAALSFRHGSLPYRNRLLSLCGMTLFAACDVNVALYNSGLSGHITHYAYVLIWMFYLPAQLLLAVSGYKFLSSQHNMG